jgi:sigma-B regulation protein RsbU (phosphoserine phosphatase)
MKRLPFAMLLGFILCSSPLAAQAIDLTALPMYVREVQGNFEFEWTLRPPEELGDQWLKVEPSPGYRPIIIRDLQLPGSSGGDLIPVAGSPYKEYAVACSFIMAQGNAILGAPEGIAMFLAHIGTNWEIYLNGYKIRSELFLGDNGRINRERNLRGFVIQLDKRYLNIGADKPNVLVFRIFGDPKSDRTGFNMGGPYLIDSAKAIGDLTNESLDLMFMGIYFFFALYHMILFAMRPKNKTYLVYGIATLVLTVYLLMRSYLVYDYILDTYWIKVVEYASFAMLMPTFALFFDNAIRGKSTLATKILLAFSGTCAIVMVTPLREFGLKVYQYSLLVALGYIFVWDLAIPLGKTFMTTFRERTGGIAGRLFWSIGHTLIGSDVGKLFLGTLVVAFTASYDLFASIAGASVVSSRYGFLFLVFGAAAVLGAQFIKVYHDVEELNVTLEKKVEDRTAQLAKAMDEQTVLNGELASINGKLTSAMDIAAKDMRMAMHVQQGLFLREAPHTEDWEIAFEFHPATGVSGDFYDFFSKGHKLTGVIVGDVSGHGIASGMITVLAKSIMFRRFSQGHSFSLGRVIEQANHELVRELSSVDNYLTAVLLRLDGDKVEYVNAAHTEIFYRAAGKARAAILKPKDNDDYKGTPLGIEGMEAMYQAMRFSVGEGDSILIYTDCLNEARNVDGDEFGTEGIQSAYARAPEGDARQMLDFIMQEWRVHVGGAPITDDLTAVLIRRTGK